MHLFKKNNINSRYTFRTATYIKLAFCDFDYKMVFFFFFCNRKEKKNKNTADNQNIYLYSLFYNCVSIINNTYIVCDVAEDDVKKSPRLSFFF